MSLTYDDLKRDTRNYFEELESQRKRAVDILYWIVRACVARGFPEDCVWVQPIDERDLSAWRPLPEALGSFRNDHGAWTLRLVLRIDGTSASYSTFSCEPTIHFDVSTGEIQVAYTGGPEVTLLPFDSTTNEQALDKFVSELFHALKMTNSSSSVRRVIGFATQN